MSSNAEERKISNPILSTRHTAEIQDLVERLIAEREAEAALEKAPEQCVPRLLKAPAVANLLQTNTQAVYRLAREGKLPAVPLGERTLRWTEESIAEFIARGGIKAEPVPFEATKLAEANSKR